MLVCHPDDVGWFENDRVLPGMTRTTGRSAGPGGLELAPTERLPQGVALLDSPDIDSVVDANRALARQLLAAADAWLFVTTAARYADAVPWELLQAARDRGTALSLVLDRVPPEAAEEVADHLRTMMHEQGLQDTQLLVVPETPLEDGRLPAAALEPVREWLDWLAADANGRAELVRRTLTGALDSLPPTRRLRRPGRRRPGGDRDRAHRRDRPRLRAGARRDRRRAQERRACCAARCWPAGTRSWAPAI